MAMDDDEGYRRKLVKNIQMLATLVATATYAGAFNPPGGVWQDIHHATDDEHLPGDPIMQSTHHGRYVVFFYCNAAAFAFSLAVVVLTLLFTSTLIKKRRLFPVILMSLMLVAMSAVAAAYGAGACQDELTVAWYCLLVPGPLASFIYQIVLLSRPRGSGGSSMGDVQAVVDKKEKEDQVVSKREKEEDQGKHFRKLMIPVSMFALTITYVAGLSTPGGFWDSAEAGHRPGDAILKDRLHGRTLRFFLLGNTLAFAASLYSVSIVMHKKTSVAGFLARLNIIVVVLGLLGGLLFAYTSASSRGRHSTGWLTEAVLGCIVLYVPVYVLLGKAIEGTPQSTELGRNDGVPSRTAVGTPADEQATVPQIKDEKATKPRQPKLVQLMASLAVAITYQAGLYPPGGLWPTNTDGHTAGDPILLTTNNRRYKGFHYCNSLSFVASLLAMLLVQKESLHKHHALEAAMLLDMLGLIGAYAIGSCRDQVSTLYIVGIAGAVVVYVFVHVSYYSLVADDEGVDAGGATINKEEQEKENKLVEKTSNRFLTFAILVASMTYQAGLTPPGGFLLADDHQSGQHAGDPVLRYNYPRRYAAFFYCNSVSFMVSIVIILLIINRIEYKPAIRSHALSVCSVVSYVCLMGAFAAGSTQHMKGSLYVFVLAVVVTFFFCIAISLWLWQRRHEDDKRNGSNSNTNSSMETAGNSTPASAPTPPTNGPAPAPAPDPALPTNGPAPAPAPAPAPPTNGPAPAPALPTNGPLGDRAQDIENMGPGGGEEEEARTTPEKKNKQKTSKSVYLVTLAILVASATYPAGLDPPGGSWQSSSDGHDAGNPTMLDNRRPRYFAFFLSNTTSFMASIILVHMLLPAMLRRTEDLHELYRQGLKGLVYLQCLGFLVAYAAGSSRQWKTSVYTGGSLVIFMLTFFFMHVALSTWLQKKKKKKRKNSGGDGEQNAQQ